MLAQCSDYKAPVEREAMLHAQEHHARNLAGSSHLTGSYIGELLVEAQSQSPGQTPGQGIANCVSVTSGITGNGPSVLDCRDRLAHKLPENLTSCSETCRHHSKHTSALRSRLASTYSRGWLSRLHEAWIDDRDERHLVRVGLQHLPNARHTPSPACQDT